MNTVYLLSWVIGLCALWYVWTLGLRRLALEWFRDKLFGLRYELFRLGQDGQIAFDNPAYRSVETLICGLLRYAHRMTLLTYFSSLRHLERSRADDKSFVDVGQQLALKVSRLDPEIQKTIADILMKVRNAVTVYMVLSSALFLVTCLVVVILKRLGFHVRTDRKKLVTVIEQEAYRSELRRPNRLAMA